MDRYTRPPSVDLAGVLIRKFLSLFTDNDFYICQCFFNSLAVRQLIRKFISLFTDNDFYIYQCFLIAHYM